MDFLTALLVGKPFNILAVALILLASFVFVRKAVSKTLFPRSLQIAFFAWAFYAAWEFLVQSQTPEANIRVDLMLIWPTIAVITLWAFYHLWGD